MPSDAKRWQYVMTEPLYFFSKTREFYELSNFAPYGIEEDGVCWPTVEHYFQAQKFPGEDFRAYRERIRRARSPQEAKKLGRSRGVPIRDDWEEVKEDVMLHALRLKFRDKRLRALLVETAPRDLVEASPSDYYWGCGKDGTGLNRLGALLMRVRSEIIGDC